MGCERPDICDCTFFVHVTCMFYCCVKDLAIETQALLFSFFFFCMFFAGCRESLVPMEQRAPFRYDLPKSSSDPTYYIPSFGEEHPLALEPISPQCNNERAEDVPRNG